MDTIRTAILGQGRSGRDIHGAYLSRDTERYRIVAVVDPLEERRERAQAEYGCDTYADYTSLLERDDLDLVVNAAPSSSTSLSRLRSWKRASTCCAKSLSRPGRRTWTGSST